MNQGFKQVGEYVFVSELGRGQFGTVYKARLKSNPSAVFAIKTIDKKKM